MRIPGLNDWRVSIDAAGIVALADLSTVAKRTALTGTSSWLDVLVIAPGFHRQQAAVELNQGEYPACAAMTTGYVFRVENEAMVLYLQKVGKTGHLTTVELSNMDVGTSRWRKVFSTLNDFHAAPAAGSLVYITAVLLTVACLVIFALYEDWWV